MTTAPELESAHPLCRAVASLLDDAAAASEISRLGLTTTDKEEALLGVAQAGELLGSLKLLLLAEADDVAERHAARSSGAWLARQTRHDPAAGRAEAKLASALESRWSVVQEAFRIGDLNRDQVRVIVAALDGLPRDTDVEVLALAEATLVELAADLSPKQLKQCGWRILEIIAPGVVDEREREALERAEASARRQTKLTMRRTAAGMVRITADVPALHGELLKTQLHALVNPRRDHLEQEGAETSGGAAAVDGARHDAATGERIPYSELMGQALCSWLERIDLSKLPVHGASAASLVIHLDFDRLRAGLQTATIAGGELSLSPGEARRLACNSQIIPAVLGGKSEVMDLGRGQRLFSTAQRAAKSITHPYCQADGCDIPASWTEAHHLVPWEHGGATDLDSMALLCSYHHHRIHDPVYDHHWHPGGSVTFRRRS